MTLTFTYANSTTPIAGVKVIMTESDGTITILTTDVNGQVTLPNTTNTYTLTASLAETGEDPISLIDAIQILQYGGELRTLTADQKTAADVNADGEVDILDAIWILQHLGELRTLDKNLIFLDANTGNPLSETTFSASATPSIKVILTGDVDQSFDPTLITDHAPILTGKTTLVMDENEITVSALVGTDADSDTLTYSITGGADKDLFTIDTTTGVLSFIAGPDYEDPSDSGGDNLYDIEITVSDGSNDTVQALVVSVNDLNEKMAMTNKTINENSAGATVGDLSIIDTAFGNNNITYALSGDDATYFVLEGNTIKLKSDVSADYETKNSYTLTVTATNSSGETAEEKVVVKIANVNETPTLNTAVANQSNNEDAAFSFTVPITAFTDVDGDTLTYSATLSDGTALPSWLSFDAAARTFTGTPLNADVGAINVKVNASDGSLSASDTFTLTVINTNDDPTAVTLSATAIDENINGGVIGDLTTSDDDNIHGDSHTYALSGADADSFEVVNGQLKLKSGVSPNYETKSSYAVTVTSTDGSGSTFAQSFSLSINDVNEAPTDITLSANVVDENASGGTVIGSVGASDEDTGDSLTFSISGSDNSYFEIVNGQVQVKSNASINFEENSSLNITINATDSGGLTSSKDYTVTVNDVNDAPTAINLSSYGVRDDVDGAIVGNITTADEDSGDAHTYTISDDRFEIVDGQLKLKSGNSVQYDTEETITFTLTTTDTAGETWSQEITINVGSIILSATSFAENSAGAAVGNLTIIDTSFSSNVTYTLSGSDADSFEIVNAVLKLKDSVSADFESKSSYSITITAADDASNEVSIDYSILVTDNNDAPTVANAIANQSVNEDSAFSYTVSTDAFSDVDAGDSLTYSAALADGSVLPSWLSFNTSTLAFSGTPLNDDVGAVNVKVTATDGSSATVSDTFTLTVANTNDAPTLANVISDQNINEDSALSYTVPTNTFNDIDVGDSFTYTATLSDGSALPSWLSFNTSTQTFSGTPLNDDVGNISVKVTATDGSSAAISDTFTVTIANTNDTPTVANAIANQSVNEDSALSFTVASNTFNDVDTGDSLTYSATLADGSALPSWLSFNTSTLAFSGTPLNANVGAINVKVTATDGSSATVSDTFTLTIANTNDAPTAVSLSATAINENSSGVVVGTLSTSDVDSGDSFTYTLSGDDKDSFEVVNGQLKLKSGVSADYENKTSYAVTVTSTDSGSATTSQSFTVTVNNVNEAPTGMSISNSTIDESQLGITVGNISVTDPDANNTFTYSLSGTDQSYFEISSGGVLKLKGAKYADYEVKSTLSVIVTATDQGGLTYAKTFTISVNDLAYATPYVPDLVPVLVDETSSSVNTMLSGWSWDNDDDASTPLTLTYSIITTDSVFSSDYFSGTNFDELHENIANASSAMITAVDKALELISQFTGITFVKVTESSTQCGDIRIGVTTSSQLNVGASMQYVTADSADHGDIWIRDTYDDGSFSVGSFSFMTILHEIGHSMGLKHPHETGLGASSWITPIASQTYDNLWYTLMAYRDYPGDNWGSVPDDHSAEDANGNDIYNYTYMSYDILALRYLYSWNKQTSSYVTLDITDDESYGIGGTGNNTYSITSSSNTGKGMFTIFDTGGTDTIDFSTLSLGSTINLHETLSYIGTSVIGYDISNGVPEYSSGLVIGIYYDNSIENVNAGSGNDVITCNSATNVINCGSGTDVVVSIGSGDTINGNDGNDGFNVTSNSFTLIDGGGGGSDTLYLYQGYSANSSGTYSGYVDLRTFTDAQLTNIEVIDITYDSAVTKLIITKDTINNLEGALVDVDGDGDGDNIVYITASSSDQILMFQSEGWAYYGSSSNYYFYSINNNETFFAWNISAGNILYQFTSGSPKPKANENSSTPTVDVIPIETIEISEDNPTILVAENNDPGFNITSDIDVLDNNDPGVDDTVTSDTDLLDNSDPSFLGLWANDFDTSSITLPETVIDEMVTEGFDLTDLYGLLGSQTDSLALNFEAFADDTGIEIEAVKPVDLSTFNSVLDHYQDPWLEDLVYTSELG